MIEFWFFQSNEKTENYYGQMTHEAVVIIPEQHITVSWTILIDSCFNPAASIKIESNRINLESLKFFSKEQF